MVRSILGGCTLAHLDPPPLNAPIKNELDNVEDTWARWFRDVHERIKVLENAAGLDDHSNDPRPPNPIP